MTMRCKFRCTYKVEYAYGIWKVVCEAVHDDSIPENQRFSREIPAGSFEMTITKADIAARFIPGESIHVEVPFPD